MIARVLLTASVALAACGERSPEQPHQRVGKDTPLRELSALPASKTEADAPGGAAPLSQLRSLVETAFTDTDEVAAELAFFLLIESLTPENAPRVYEMILPIKTEGSQERLKRLAEMRAQVRDHWSALDGEGAVAFALENFNGERLGVFLRDVLPTWGGANPEAAIAWGNAGGAKQIDDTYRKLGEHSYPRFEGSAFHDVPHLLVRGIAETDAELAAGFASQFESSDTVHVFELFETISARALAERGAAASLAWAEAFEREKIRHAAVFGLANAQARSDPAGAAAWFGAYADQPWAGPVVRAITEELARTDPGAAAGWHAGPRG